MSDFGSPDGLGKRLASWARQLGGNKQFPWVGTGLIDDLECAAEMLEPGSSARRYQPEKLEYDI